MIHSLSPDPKGRTFRRALVFAALATGLVAVGLGAQESGDAGWDLINTWNGKISPDAAQVGSAAAPPAEANLPPVPIDFLAVPQPRQHGDGAYVPILIEVAGPELIEGHLAEQLAGQFDGAARDGAGTVVGRFSQPFVLRLDDETRATLERSGLKLFAELNLPPGDYELEVQVVNTVTGARGEIASSLSVPDFAGATLSPPLVPEALGRWKTFRQATVAGEPEPYPFLAPGGGAFMPAAVPVVSPGDPLTVHLVGFNLPVDGTFSGRVIDSESGQPIATDVSVEASEDGPLTSQTLLSVALPGVPTDPGRYRLEIAGAGSTSSLAFVVSADAPPPTVVGQAIASTDQPPPEEPEALHGSVTEAETDRIYRESIALAAAGEYGPANAKLRGLEEAATAGRKNGEVRALRKIQLKALKPLLKQRPDAVIPVIYLHFLADEAYLGRGQIWNAAQSRVFVADLIEEYAKASKSPEADRLGGQLLATVGRPNDALVLDPDNVLALLRLAINEEKAARHREALAHLEHLVSVDPTNRHALLRYGVNLDRVHRTPEAKRVLAAVVRQPENDPEWIVGLAYQELAAIEMREGQSWNAVAILQAATERLGHQRHFLQLAFYHDHRNERDQAIEVLNRMKAVSSVDQVSPRHLYNSEPSDELMVAREQFRRVADSRRSQLAQLVSHGGAGDRTASP